MLDAMYIISVVISSRDNSGLSTHLKLDICFTYWIAVGTVLPGGFCFGGCFIMTGFKMRDAM